MTDVTKDDLRDVRDTILDEMRDGFAGVHRRQDVTNGRVNAGEVQGATHEAKIRNLEAQVFGRRDSDQPPPKPADDDRTITQRDVRMVVYGACGLASVVGFFWKALPFVLKALTP